MLSIRAHQTGGIDVVKAERVPVPELSDTQVLVKTAYNGINFIDNYFRSGLYKAPKWPHVFGRDGSGIVVKAGPAVTRVKVGDAVVWRKALTAQEYNALEQDDVWILPENFPLEIGGAMLTQGMTAVILVSECFNVRKGDDVLIHAAAGGTGSLLVQLALARGANVIATTSSEEKAALIRKAGVQHVINHRTDDIAGRVKEITGGKGVEVVYDGIGKDTFDASLDALAVLGVMVSYGNASGAVEPFTVARLSPKSLTVMRPVVDNYCTTFERRDRFTRATIEAVANGQLKIDITQKFKAVDYGKAMGELESGKTVGKIVVEW